TPSTLAAVRAACVAGFGRECELVASGGSIPAVVALEAAFGCSPVLLGIGPVDDGAHGPDEHLDLGDWARGVRTSVALLHLISSESHPSGSRPRPSKPARHVSVGRTGRGVRAAAEKSSGKPQRLETP